MAVVMTVSANVTVRKRDFGSVHISIVKICHNDFKNNPISYCRNSEVLFL